jgi:hypothetical protein
MTGAMIATGILFFPVAPLFLFMKGKNITIPKGIEITAYVAGDTPLEQARFVNAEVPASTVVASARAPADTTSAALIKSNPDGADITIDAGLEKVQ